MLMRAGVTSPQSSTDSADLAPLVLFRLQRNELEHVVTSNVTKAPEEASNSSVDRPSRRAMFRRSLNTRPAVVARLGLGDISSALPRRPGAPGPPRPERVRSRATRQDPRRSVRPKPQRPRIPDPAMHPHYRHNRASYPVDPHLLPWCDLTLLQAEIEGPCIELRHLDRRVGNSRAMSPTRHCDLQAVGISLVNSYTDSAEIKHPTANGARCVTAKKLR